MFSPAHRPVTLSVLIISAALIWAAPLSAQWQENGNLVTHSNQSPAYHEICADGEGGAFISRTDGGQVYVHRMDAYGRSLWAPGGIDVSSDTGIHANQVILADGFGGAIVVFARISPWDPADVWAQRIDADGNLLWGAAGDSVCSASGPQSSFCLTTDGSGGAIIAWQDYRGTHYDIYAQHIDANGTVQWTADGVALCTATNGQYSPQIVSDLDRGAIIGWQDDRAGSGSRDLYVSRVASNGFLYWEADGELICDATGGQYDLRMVSDGMGGAILSWADYRSSTFVYAQRISVNGGIQWTDNGAQLTSAATDYQLDPVLVADGVGGAIVAWEDYRGTGMVGIYGQHVDGSGTPLWGTLGAAIQTLGNSPDEIQITTDHAGGAIVTWEDSRTGSEDIYAQRVAPDSTVMWDPWGVPLCTEITTQYSPRIVPDGEGGAIVVWQDSQTTDLVAQRVERNGHWGYPSGVISTCNDVPGDQGGLVNLAWYASRLDPWPDMQVDSYTLWRAIEQAPSAPFTLLRDPGLALSTAGAERVGPVIRMEETAEQTFFWELVDTQDAYHLASYSKTIPTLFDSTDVTDRYHYFQVMAHGIWGEFWISPPDSARSVDNLAPAVPQGLAGTLLQSPDGIDLIWFANAEEDLSHYAVYRGLTSDFTADAGSFVTDTEDTTCFDPGGGGDLFYYKLFAVDIHGNESPFALLSPTAVTAVGDDRRVPVTRLAQNTPNPFFGAGTRIAYSLREATDVSLRVYDASGRLVRVLAEEPRSAGPHEAVWDGRNVFGQRAASGVYYYRLNTAEFTRTRRMVLLR